MSAFLTALYFKKLHSLTINISITSVVISNFFFGSFIDNCSLTTLNLRGIEISAEGANALANNLYKLPNLVNLILNCNSIND